MRLPLPILPSFPAPMLALSLLLLASPVSVLAKAPAMAKASEVGNARIARAVDPAHRTLANVALDEARNPGAVLAFSDVRPGATVVDYSAGGGYYSEMLATMVGPKGKVYATSNPRFFKPEPWEPIRAAHPNILLLVQPDGEAQLAPDSVDMIFTHLVFHDMFLPARAGQPPRHPERIIANWFVGLKHGGYVIIADHVGPTGDVSEIAGRMHRIAPASARAIMEAAGFVLVGQSDVLHRSDDDHSQPISTPGLRGKTDRFLMKFRKP